MTSLIKQVLIPDFSEVLKRVGLEDSKTKVSYYTDGMKQKLSIAYAMAGNPELLILDDPATGLETNEIIALSYLLQELAEQGKTVFITGSATNELLDICTKVCTISDGITRKQKIKRVLEIHTLREEYSAKLAS